MAKKSLVPSKKDTRFIEAIRSKAPIKIRIPKFLTPQLVIFCATIIATMLLFPYKETTHSIDLPKLGEAAKETVIAPFTFDIIRSQEELEKERKKAVDQVLQVLDYDPGVWGKVKEKFLDLKKSVNLLIDSSTSEDSVRSRKHTISKYLSENTINNLLKRPYLIDDAMDLAEEMLDRGVSSILLVPAIERLSELRSRYNTSFNQHLFYDRQFVTLRHDTLENTVPVTTIVVKEIALENAIKDLRRDRVVDDEALNTVYELLFAFIVPNIKINSQIVAQRKEKAARDVLEITGKVVKDTEIVRKHQEVTAEIIQKLNSLQRALENMGDSREKQKTMASNAGRLAVALIPLLLIAFYLNKFKVRLVKSTKHLLALAILLMIQVIVIRVGMFIASRLFSVSAEVTHLIPEYIIPLATGSLLSAILFGFEISFILTLYSSILFGILMGFSEHLFLYTLLGGIVSAFYGRNIRYRLHFFKTITPVALISGVIIFLWQLIGYKLTFVFFIQNFGLALISVIVSTFLAMMFTPIFERLFDITTDMTLVELSDMNHPVLKRLSIEAAGTYNHSVLVGNLAESAAQKIGANPLLARVASYYHDIGKIEKSDYFVENCLTVDKSRHNKLTPSMSALIICAHVKDGVDLAKKYNVPKVIQDIIMQHHGTSTVSYFYEKALELDPHKQVQEKDFSYPGPAPQTREAAIIMLADSVEAAARSLGTSSPKLLRDLVKKIIRDKFLSSQLDQSDLTLRDLDEIVEGFMPVLQGIFHSRIEYPSREKENKL